MKFLFSAIWMIWMVWMMVDVSNADEQVKQLKKACMAKTGISIEDYNRSRDEGDFSTPKIDEFYYCILKMGNFLDENEKFIPDKIIGKVRGLFGDDVAQLIRRNCVDGVDEQGIKAAVNFAKCFTKFGPKHDL